MFRVLPGPRRHRGPGYPPHPMGGVRSWPSAATWRRPGGRGINVRPSTSRCSRSVPRSRLLAASSPQGDLPPSVRAKRGTDTNLNAIAAAVIRWHQACSADAALPTPALLGILVIQSISSGLACWPGLLDSLHGHRRRAAARGHHRLAQPAQPGWPMAGPDPDKLPRSARSDRANCLDRAIVGGDPEPQPVIALVLEDPTAGLDHPSRSGVCRHRA